MIVLCLESGPRRFGVLRRHLRPISTKVLAETLTAMGRDGLVWRCPVEGADDGGVEYGLTPLGRTLLDVITHTRDWARTHLGELVRARDAFDQAATAAGSPGTLVSASGRAVRRTRAGSAPATR
ncbi:winged helix-turn-helix transcriptional regulator [Micromonospora sp. NPDC003944]